MRCPSCGQENADDTKSCGECGTFLGPTLAVDNPSEDEVPTHLGLAIVAAALPLLCATGGWLALLCVPLGLYALVKARSVEEHLQGRRPDVLAATAASIHAQRFAIGAIVLAFVLSLGQLAYQVTRAPLEPGAGVDATGEDATARGDGTAGSPAVDTEDP